ncbi:MAG: ABC transporter substrate-binding protein, partial [Desulfobacterales bacterium]|nr:ABC transporter substrate-binding protein [Desulfobacterales bacterium]
FVNRLGEVIFVRSLCLWIVVFSWLGAAPLFAASPILIGLDADMSSGSSRSGIAIQRGILIAMDEINRSGGVLGRPLELVVRDHRGNPARGKDNIEELAAMKGLVAVVGGLHTPVVLAELPVIHKTRLLHLVPWAAGTPVVENGYTPNFVFRVSVRDQYAGPYLAGRAIDGYGYKRPGLLLEQTGWGRSNNRAMTDALNKKGITAAGLQWFLWGAGKQDMKQLVTALKSNGADVILFVGNAPEGIALIQAMAALPGDEQLPILSHWGITGGSFFKSAEKQLASVDLRFLQTYSFLKPPFPARAEAVFTAYKKRWPEIKNVRELFAPVGTAHAYDLIYLLKMAVEKAGDTDRDRVRSALEHLEGYEGLVKNYQPPFTAENHDALDTSDFQMARYAEDGAIVPID